MGWLSAGNGGSTVKKPVFITSGWVNYDGNSSDIIVIPLTAAQKTAVAGFTHPLYTVQATVKHNTAQSYNCNISLGLRSTTNPSGWSDMMPTTSAVMSTQIPAGVFSGSLCVSSQHDYDLDNVVVQLIMGDGNHPPTTTQAMITVKVEEVEV